MHSPQQDLRRAKESKFKIAPIPGQMKPINFHTNKLQQLPSPFC